MLRLLLLVCSRQLRHLRLLLLQLLGSVCSLWLSERYRCLLHHHRLCGTGLLSRNALLSFLRLLCWHLCLLLLQLQVSSALRLLLCCLCTAAAAVCSS